MGYSSITKATDKNYNLALIAGKTLTEASSKTFWDVSKYRLASIFNTADICDDGKVYLRNGDDFVCFE